MFIWVGLNIIGNGDGKEKGWIHMDIKREYTYIYIYIYMEGICIYIYNIDAMLKDWAYREHTEHGKSCERSNAINLVMAGLLVYGMNRSPHYL